MSDVYDILVRSRELLSDPAHWTRGAMARDKNGHATGPAYRNATCWCATGVVEKARRELKRPRAARADALLILNNIVWEDSMDTVPMANDHPQTKHEDILKLFDQAIAATKEAQP